MIRDDLDLQLASHLQGAADLRLPEGLVDHVVSRTATIRRRPAWAVALRGNVLRPAASLASNPVYRLVAVALLVLVILGLALAAGGAPRSPFEGRWISVTVDTDGSTQHVVIGPGWNPEVVYDDGFSALCQASGDADPRWHGEARGTVTDQRLALVFTQAGCTIWRVHNERLAFDYDPVTRQLLDSNGIAWRRLP
jgi:hypothetical protein